jgi:hypothetical protein
MRKVVWLEETLRSSCLQPFNPADTMNPPTNETPTPLTDAHEFPFSLAAVHLPPASHRLTHASFSRSLERKLAESNAKLATAREALEFITRQRANPFESTVRIVADRAEQALAQITP